MLTDGRSHALLTECKLIFSLIEQSTQHKDTTDAIRTRIERQPSMHRSWPVHTQRSGQLNFHSSFHCKVTARKEPPQSWLPLRGLASSHHEKKHLTHTGVGRSNLYLERHKRKHVSSTFPDRCRQLRARQLPRNTSVRWCCRPGASIPVTSNTVTNTSNVVRPDVKQHTALFHSAPSRDDPSYTNPQEPPRADKTARREIPRKHCESYTD